MRHHPYFPAIIRLAAFVACCGLITGSLFAQARRTTSRSGASRSGSGYGAGTREYRPSTMLGDALVEVDLETRSLIVITDEDTNAEIGTLIKDLDRPKPQVLIKVLFVEVTQNNDLDFGIEGSYAYTHQGINQGTAQTLFGSPTQGGFYNVMADDWEVTLHALAEEGKLEILSRPSILARNNQEAVIMVGQEVPRVTNSQITNNGLINNTVDYVDVGIILRVTPFITPEGLVEMIVAPEISTKTDETVQISETLSSPVFAKRYAETVVVTPNGKTVVIGGLIESRKTDAVKKVPVLGDIPLLKYAFRRTVKQDTKTELLIFLTPFIVETPEGLADLSQQEIRDLKLTPQAFPKDGPWVRERESVKGTEISPR